VARGAERPRRRGRARGPAARLGMPAAARLEMPGAFR